MKNLVIAMFLVLILAAHAQAAVRHFVAFRYKSGVTAAQRAEVRRRFLELQRSVREPSGRPYILSIEAGDATSPEGQDQGMTDGYLVTFKDAADRDYYVGRPKFAPFDPAHDAFKAFVGPLLDGVFVFDYEVK